MGDNAKSMNTDRSFVDSFEPFVVDNPSDTFMTMEVEIFATLFQSRFEGSATLYVWLNLDDRRAVVVDLDVVKDVSRNDAVEGATVVKCPPVLITYKLSEAPFPEDLIVGMSIQTVWDDNGEAASMPGGAAIIPLGAWLKDNEGSTKAQPFHGSKTLETRLFSDHMVKGATEEDDVRGRVDVEVRLTADNGIHTAESDQRQVVWGDKDVEELVDTLTDFHLRVISAAWMTDIREQLRINNVRDVIKYLPQIRPVAMEAPSAGRLALWMYMMHGKRWRPDGIGLFMIMNSLAYEIGRRGWSIKRFNAALDDLYYDGVERGKYTNDHVESLDIVSSVGTHIALALKYRQDAYTAGVATGKQRIVNGEDHGDAVGDDAADDGAGGDCDDLNEITLAVLNEIRRLQFFDAMSPLDRATVNMIGLLRTYVMISWTLSVNGADARSAASGDTNSNNPFTNKDVGAHANGYLIPAHVYLEMLQQNIPALDTLPTELFDYDYRKGDAEDVKDALEKSTRMNLPILCLESTGSMYSVLTPLSDLMGRSAGVDALNRALNRSNAMLAPSDVGSLGPDKKYLPIGPEWDVPERRSRPDYVNMDVQAPLMNFYNILSTAYLVTDKLLLVTVDGMTLMLNTSMPTRQMKPPDDYVYRTYRKPEFGHGFSAAEIMGEIDIGHGLLPVAAPSAATINALTSTFISTKPNRGVPAPQFLVGKDSQSRLVRESRELGVQLVEKRKRFNAIMESALKEKFSPNGLVEDSDVDGVDILSFTLHNTKTHDGTIRFLAQDIAMRPRVLRVTLYPEWSAALNATWTLSLALQISDGPIHKDHPVFGTQESTAATRASDASLEAVNQFNTPS